MSRSLYLLTPEFRDKVKTVLEECESNGYPMRPFFTVRTVEEQAKLWRQSRTTQQIHEAIAYFKREGAEFLAAVLESVGPQNGPHVTNALPGYSWHQWAEACDCFWLVDGKAEWSTSRIIDNHNGYREYARIAQNHGLTAGGYWRSVKDWPHVQLRQDSSPRSAGLSLREIDAEMQRRYS